MCIYCERYRGHECVPIRHLSWHWSVTNGGSIVLVHIYLVPFSLAFRYYAYHSQYNVTLYLFILGIPPSFL